MKQLKENKAITLIALVVTIIVLIILAGVSINLIVGENGIIDRSKEAKFKAEFSEIQEKVIMYWNNKEAEAILFGNNLTAIEKLPVTTVINNNELKETLKKEIEEVSKKTLNEVELYMIDENKILANKKHDYIIDIVTLQIYDIEGEKFSGKWHHTLNGIGVDGGNDEDIIGDDPTVTIEDDIGWYAPNLDGFNGTYTYMIYYNEKDDTDIKEVPIKEYIQKGKQNKIEEKGKTYVLDDYENKIWANVKTVANGLETWWVWIPRYAYIVNGISDVEPMGVIFVDLENNPIGTRYESLPEGYSLHPGFTETLINKNGEVEVIKELQGIWMSKYEPTNTPNANYTLDSGECYTPDMTGFDKEYTYIEYFNVKTNTFDKEILLKDANLSTINDDNRWYNYNEKVWANVKTVANGIECWWVWIPRYAYSVATAGQEMDIIFIDLNNTPIDKAEYGTKLPEGMEVHPAFTVKNEDGTVKELKGIWMSKYEPSTISSGSKTPITGECYSPDMTGFDENYTYIEYFNLQTNTFDGEISLKDAKEQGLDTINTEKRWYDYANKKWANVKTTANGIECWWVWIPRYAYSVGTAGQEMDIVFIDLENTPIDKAKYGNTLKEGMEVHPAFRIKNEDGTVKELKGIWMSKYEPSYVSDTVSGTTPTGGTDLEYSNDQAGKNHTHLGNGSGTKLRYVTSSTKWCSAYNGTPCSNNGYYIYCSLCGVRMRHYWCANHYNVDTKVIIEDENVN